MSWRIVCISSVSKLDYKMGYLVVRNQEGLKRVHLSEISVLTIEHPIELRRFLMDLKNQINGLTGEAVLSEDFELLEFSNAAILLTDIFTIDFSSRKLVSKIYEDVCNSASAYQEDLHHILILLNQLAVQITMNMDFDASFTELNDSTILLKQLNFCVDTENLSYPEQLILYIKLQQRFLKKKLVILYNLKSCFSVSELEAFYQTIQYEKLSILLIENMQRDPPLSMEHTMIIDKDLCVF